MAPVKPSAPHVHVHVEVDGSTRVGGVETLGGTWIASVEVDQRWGHPDFFAVEYALMVRGELRFADAFEPGQRVRIALARGAPHAVDPLCEGRVSRVELDFDPADGGSVRIEGFDRSHVLGVGTGSRSWPPAQPGADPARAAASSLSDVLAAAGTADGSRHDGFELGAQSGGPAGPAAPRLVQSERAWAAAVGLPLGRAAPDAEGKLDAGLPEPVEPSVHVSRDRPEGPDGLVAYRAHFRLDVASQVSAVVVRGWDPAGKRVVEGRAAPPGASWPGRPAGRLAAQARYGGECGRVLEVVRAVRTEAAAQAVADNLAHRLALRHATAQLELPGDPRLRPGVGLALHGFGARFSGAWTVLACTHVFEPGATPYVTEVLAARAAS